MMAQGQLRIVLFFVLVLFVPLSLWGDEPSVQSKEDQAVAQANHVRRPGIIKIATIGSLPSSMDANSTSGQMVRHVIDHWKGRFAQVLPDRPDLIVVPETCDVIPGLSGKPLFEYYEARSSQVIDYFAAVAKENRCYITYPAVMKQDDGTWRNSITLLDRSGNIAGAYHKNHPTISEIEQGILPGIEVPIIECDFGRVALAICFDLNFDVLRFKYAKTKPDLIVFCSAYHGGLMQAYWAYSCRSHFVGAIYPKCNSEIYNPLGQLVASTTNYFDFAVATVNLDCELAHLDYNWARLTALKKKYGLAVKITDPGQLGSVMITSSHESIGVQEMIDEFEIERLDDYLNRALEYRSDHVAADEKIARSVQENSLTTPANTKSP